MPIPTETKPINDPAVAAEINAALQALAGYFSSAIEPATKYPYQFWADTTTGILKQRNAANSAWISLFSLTNREWAGNAATATTAAGNSFAASVINAAPLLHNNDIINGDFRIAQAGASFAAPATGAYDLDGWLNVNPTTAVFTVEQVAGSTAGRLARQVTVTTADTVVAVGDVLLDQTRIEGYNIEKYVGTTFTVAFRARVPVAGIHCVALRNSNQDRSYVVEINFPTANVWQNCSFTVVGGLPIAGTWNYTNGVGLEVTFSHMCGATFQTAPGTWNTGNFLATANQVNDCATLGNFWAMEKVTLNLGTVAAVGEISFEQELARCQRYYEKGELRNQIAQLGYLGQSVPFASGKRAAPTMTFTDTAGTAGTFTQGATNGSTLILGGVSGTVHDVRMDAIPIANMVANNNWWMVVWTAAARL